MDGSPPIFLDESTLRFCPHHQILQVVEVESYGFFIGEEVVHGVRRLDCAGWVAAQLAQGRLNCHRITRLNDIRLVTQIVNRCGVCRGEACSYVAAKRENGIVVAQDLRAHEILTRHVPGVTTINPETFIRSSTHSALLCV